MGLSPDDLDDDEITIRRSDGWFVARHEATGVTSQGETETEAIENLAEAVSLYNQESEDEFEPEPSTAPWF